MPRVYERKFAWDEAIARRAAGETYTKIANDMGVTITAVRHAVNPRERERAAKVSRGWVRRAACPDCGKKTTRQRKGEDHRCRECASKLKVTSVRPDTLYCSRCQEWKPDEDFPHNRSEPARRLRHGACRACNTIVRREHRRRNMDAQRAYDRAYYLRKRSRMQRATSGLKESS